MKKLIITIAILSCIATPVFAQELDINAAGAVWDMQQAQIHQMEAQQDYERQEADYRETEAQMRRWDEENKLQAQQRQIEAMQQAEEDRRFHESQ